MLCASDNGTCLLTGLWHSCCCDAVLHCCSRLSAPVNLVDQFYHMHGLGKSAITRRFRGGQELAPLGNLRTFDYKFESYVGMPEDANVSKERERERDLHARRPCIVLQRGVMGRAPWCKGYTEPLRCQCNIGTISAVPSSSDVMEPLL